ncbi:hypothetical protein C8R43DRAFT_1132798 [Mycena crocata]|nr:hypothetical protein C8R43DRAFT_1132798 [Mycena crocata]
MHSSTTALIIPPARAVIKLNGRQLAFLGVCIALELMLLPTSTTSFTKAMKIGTETALADVSGAEESHKLHSEAIKEAEYESKINIADRLSYPSTNTTSRTPTRTRRVDHGLRAHGTDAWDAQSHLTKLTGIQFVGGHQTNTFQFALVSSRYSLTLSTNITFADLLISPAIDKIKTVAPRPKRTEEIKGSNATAGRLQPSGRPTADMRNNSETMDQTINQANYIIALLHHYQSEYPPRYVWTY